MIHLKTIIHVDARKPHRQDGPRVREKVKFVREHPTERVHAKTRKDFSFDSDAYDSSSECRCVKCQPAVVRSLAAHRELLHLEAEPRFVPRNIIQQNIKILPNTRVFQRQGSKPAAPMLNVDHDAQYMYEKKHKHLSPSESCGHGYDPTTSCPLCARDKRDRGRPRHVHDNRIHYQPTTNDDELYMAEKAVKYAIEAREAARKQKEKADEAREKREAQHRREQLDKIFDTSAQPRDRSPNSACREKAVLGMAADEVRRELEQCNAELKKCHERAAREAQSKGRRDQNVVLEQEEADRREALRYDRAGSHGPDKATKKQPISILVKKKVRFLG